MTVSMCVWGGEKLPEDFNVPLVPTISLAPTVAIYALDLSQAVDAVRIAPTRHVWVVDTWSRPNTSDTLLQRLHTEARRIGPKEAYLA